MAQSERLLNSVRVGESAKEQERKGVLLAISCSLCSSATCSCPSRHAIGIGALRGSSSYFSVTLSEALPTDTEASAKVHAEAAACAAPTRATTVEAMETRMIVDDACCAESWWSFRDGVQEDSYPHARSLGRRGRSLAGSADWLAMVEPTIGNPRILPSAIESIIPTRQFTLPFLTSGSS